LHTLSKERKKKRKQGLMEGRKLAGPRVVFWLYMVVEELAVTMA
jgi:hypothetical protein